MEGEVHCWKVYENLFLGDISASQDLELLREHNVTRVLDLSNTIKGRSGIESDEFGIERLFIPVADSSADAEALRKHFGEANAFIREALFSGYGTLVHCTEGKSRSVTALIQFMMQHRQLRLKEAWMHIVKIRPQMRPNDGFCKLLMELAAETEVPGTGEEAAMSLRDLRLTLQPGNKKVCLSICKDSCRSQTRPLMIDPTACDLTALLKMASNKLRIKNATGAVLCKTGEALGWDVAEACISPALCNGDCIVILERGAAAP